MTNRWLEPRASGSPIPPLWLVASGVLLAFGSALAVTLDWPGLIAVLAVVPGLLVLEHGRHTGQRLRGLASYREAPKPGLREVAPSFLPLVIFSLLAPYVFDTTAWAWLAPFVALMAACLALAEHLAWRRAGSEPRP